MDDSNKQPQPQTQHHHHKRKHSSKKKWVIIVSLSILILVVAAALYWFYAKGNQVSIVNRTDDEIQQIVNRTEQLNDDGESSKSESELQRAIKETAESSQKASLLDNMAYIYYENDNYDQALAAALEAELLSGNDVSDGSKAFIASIYEAKGDKQNAIKYYQQAIELLDKSYSWYESRLNDYRSSITDLGGTN